MDEKQSDLYSRRDACKIVCKVLGAGVAGLALPATLHPEEPKKAKREFRLHYILSSCMYGKMDLDVILPEVEKTGARAIDIWSLVHGNQREQIEEMGHRAFVALLERHGVRLGMFTRYPLGPFGLDEEMKVVKKLGGKMILCGTTGVREPSGAEAKKAVKEFLEKMKPHVAVAEELGVTIVLENHDRQLLYHPDALRYFAEFNRSRNLGIAFALHHLHFFVPEIPALIDDLGVAQIRFVYAQEHGKGARLKLPKQDEMMQMPGHGGGLDYRPILASLKKIDYQDWIEIFMHPVPRGIPILPTVTEVTGAINKSRDYLEQCLKEI